jgi:hypothetical protein
MTSDVPSALKEHRYLIIMLEALLISTSQRLSFLTSDKVERGYYASCWRVATLNHFLRISGHAEELGSFVIASLL